MGMQMQIHNDAEVRDTNNTKIAYKVKFFGDSEDATKTYLIASKDVKHSGTADFESQVSKLRAAHDEEWKQKYPRWKRNAKRFRQDRYCCGIRCRFITL